MTENGVAPVPPDDDRTPTQEDEAPAVKPADPWVMPEPVFRRSSGYTPKPTVVGNEDETIIPNTQEAAEVKDQPDPDAVIEAAAVSDQPDPIEESVPELAAEELSPAVKKKSGFFRVLLIILGVGAIVLAAAALVIAIALGYFFQVSESQNLN